MATDSIAYQHKEWLGLLQTVGLVVSPIALERAGAIIDRSKLIEIQAQLREIDNRIEADAPFSVGVISFLALPTAHHFIFNYARLLTTNKPR
jgi:hypothetical protein